ncbi:mRNA cap guanine-N7 methyltransferase 2-like isoform X1 [Hibiscus syriacus]|uniref:mRNA cap guanine-N7 methyltransferase 2-like isoform X1 n=1 Tax=Hibiscus syriacus TaxID=106335 RepID=UPI0019236233|nr:mRNA cap guanine-N7 methyltransferase 2-like isoform X1 [Hibiscus syriacus]
MSGYPVPGAEAVHHRLYEFAKTALIKIFVHPYATVCDLYCGGGADAEKWDGPQIGHYVGIEWMLIADVVSSGINEVREAWESQRKNFTSEFFEADPCADNLETLLQEKDIQADLVCCLQHLQLGFETEEKARRLLSNVSFLLKPGGYFFGITPDSSTIWAKYQKNVEAYHNRSSSMKPNIVPNCIRSESYTITFEIEEEKFPLFGKKYQLKFSSDVSAETHCLVHFPSLIRLAREAGLEYVEIQNLTEFYDDNKSLLSGMMLNAGPNLLDPRGRLLPRSYDVLGLYTTFIFQKPDPDLVPPVATPLLPDGSYDHDESQWEGVGWVEEEKNGQAEQPPPPPPSVPALAPPPPPHGLGKISEQKGILGPGPAELRFSEAL